MHGGDHVGFAGQEGLELGEVGEGEEESEADGRPAGLPAEPGGGRGSGGGPSGGGTAQHREAPQGQGQGIKGHPP